MTANRVRHVSSIKRREATAPTRCPRGVHSRRGCRPTRDVADGDSHAWQSLQVLVVADVQDAADRLTALVRTWGHDAQSICTRQTTRPNFRPDLVLLDMDWTPPGGRRTVLRMRREFDWEECLFVALIRPVDWEDRRQCRKAGIDLVLARSVEPTLLETLLLLECTRANRLRSNAGYSLRLT